MKNASKIFSFLTVLVFVSLFGVSAKSAEAAVTNRIIKGSGPALYWIDSTGERSVFPNVATYYTWFPTFDNILTLKDAELTGYQLTGTVTYRPGAKLVKFADSSKVYAVARYGVLRHVTSESVATGLYGSNWKSWVHDIPRSLESSYAYGAPIYRVWEYHVATEYHGSSVPGRTDGLVGATENLVANLSVDRELVHEYEDVTLLARVHRDGGNGAVFGNHRFTLRIKDGYGRVLKKCADLRENETCEYIKSSGIGFEQTGIYLAEATDTDGSYVEMGSAMVYRIYNKEAQQVTGMRVGVSNMIVRRGKTVRVTANVFDIGDVDFLGKRIRLIDARTGGTLITCHNQSWCAKDVVVERTAGEVGVQFEAVLTDEYGHELKRVFSPSVLIVD
ncbi:MAG: hypothetical protein NUV81_03195 [bacterium]|nr:hypothetical protein [bacterium]